LARHERSGALSGVTGHVAESVVEILLADIGSTQSTTSWDRAAMASTC
jgi:hypothetical protein